MMALVSGTPGGAEGLLAKQTAAVGPRWRAAGGVSAKHVITANLHLESPGGAVGGWGWGCGGGEGGGAGGSLAKWVLVAASCKAGTGMRKHAVVVVVVPNGYKPSSRTGLRPRRGPGHPSLS